MFKIFTCVCLCFIPTKVLNANNNTRYPKESTRSYLYRPSIFDLVKLGRIITTSFQSLDVPGHKFLQDLHTYKEDLSWLRAFLIDNRTEGNTVYRAIKKQRGPPFLNIELEDSQLLNAFKNWTKKEVKEVREILYQIDVFWSHCEIYSELHERESELPLFYRKQHK